MLLGVSSDKGKRHHMDNYMSMADTTYHWTFQQKKQSSRRHEKCLLCIQRELFELCPLATWKIWHFVNKVWMKSRKSPLVWIFDHFCMNMNPPYLWHLTQISLLPLFLTHRPTEMGFVWEFACCLWQGFLFNNFQMYIDACTKSCSTHSIHTSINQFNQMYLASSSCFLPWISISTYSRTCLTVTMPHTGFLNASWKLIASWCWKKPTPHQGKSLLLQGSFHLLNDYHIVLFPLILA